MNRASANPTIEALQDVAVQVHTYDAETGRTGGGIFNTATKSGTNELHGSGFYQTRPRWGMANNYFATGRQPLPETYFHLGGGGFGGPIIRNRTFFWAAAEGYGSNTTRNGHLRLPTDREQRRRLLADLRAERPARGDLRPADRRRQRQRPPAVPRQHHPGRPDQPGVARRCVTYLPTADTRRQQRQPELQAHRRDRRSRR